jgi:hypothetical protein
MVQSVEKSVLNAGDRKMRMMEEQRQKAKAEAKLHRKAVKEEQDALFGAALLAVQKKNSVSQKDGKVEAKGRDGNDEANKKTTSRAMKMMFQMDAQEMEEKLREDPNYVPTLEDDIEAQRQKKVEELKLSGKGTPVTPETFAAWQDRKRKKKLEEAKKLVEAEFKKKKGGKGLSVLSGRDLYEYKKELFDRDEEGDDAVVDAFVRRTADDDDDDSDQDEPNMAPSSNGNKEADASSLQVDRVAAQVRSDLFLGEYDDLDDLDDDEE